MMFVRKFLLIFLKVNLMIKVDILVFVNKFDVVFFRFIIFRKSNNLKIIKIIFRICDKKLIKSGLFIVFFN